MNKKIFIPLVVVATVFGGILTVDYTHSLYEPFTDMKYSDNLSTQTVIDPRLNYDGIKMTSHVKSIYPEYTLDAVVSLSSIIVIGEITDYQYIENPHDVDEKTYYSASTLYTVLVDEQLKGESIKEIKYRTKGGETNNVVSGSFGFVFEKGDNVILLLTESTSIDNQNTYTPITPVGVYKITEMYDNAKVHKFGEDKYIPLSEFKLIIQNMIG